MNSDRGLPPDAERAALLWTLLGPDGRRRIAPYLSRAELEALNRALASYRARSREERRKRELELHMMIAGRAPRWPMLLTISGAVAFGALFLLHMLLVPRVSMTLRLELFNVFFLAAVAPLTLYLLRPYRLRQLFHWRVGADSIAATFFVFLGLLWALFFVGLEQRSSYVVFRPDVFSLLILCVGALGAPLLEETLFRELIPGILGRAPHYAGHALSATLFALAHLPGGVVSWEVFVWNLTAGLLLSALRIHSDRLLYPLIAHSGANLATVLLGF